MIAVLGTPSAGTHFCDHCFASPSNPTIKAHCCDTQFCSAACLDTSLSTYHPLLCKTDLSFLYANQSDHVLNPTLLLPRLLSSYLSSSPPDTHPLSHPLLSRWKPDYRSTAPRGLAPPRFPISFATHIEQPNQIMAALGVDIFSDARFDTWVLQNLLNRVSANAHVRHPRPQHHSAPFQATAAPSETTSDPPDLIRAAAAAASSATVHNIGCLLPLLNHSCTPNVVIGEGRGGVWARAWRDIREGEELCVSYVDGAGKGAGKEEQRQSLAVWFNECLCESCRAEKKEASGISVRLNQGDERDSLETGTTR
jgi:hypothetical protein